MKRWPLNPYNSAVLGDTADEITVQLQVDLARIEGWMVELIASVTADSESPFASVILDHLHSQTARNKLALVNSLVRDREPDGAGSESELEQARLVVNKKVTRLLELRNKLSHCQNAEIHDGQVLVTHAPKKGKTETRIELEELQQFVGTATLDLADDLKYLFSLLRTK